MLRRATAFARFLWQQLVRLATALGLVARARQNGNSVQDQAVQGGGSAVVDALERGAVPTEEESGLEVRHDVIQAVVPASPLNRPKISIIEKNVAGLNSPTVDSPPALQTPRANTSMGPSTPDRAENGALSCYAQTPDLNSTMGSMQTFVEASAILPHLSRQESLTSPLPDHSSDANSTISSGARADKDCEPQTSDTKPSFYSNQVMARLPLPHFSPTNASIDSPLSVRSSDTGSTDCKTKSGEDHGKQPLSPVASYASRDLSIGTFPHDTDITYADTHEIAGPQSNEYPPQDASLVNTRSPLSKRTAITNATTVNNSRKLAMNPATPIRASCAEGSQGGPFDTARTSEARSDSDSPRTIYESQSGEQYSPQASTILSTPSVGPNRRFETPSPSNFVPYLDESDGVTPRDPRFRRLYSPNQPISVDQRTFSSRLNSAIKRDRVKQRFRGPGNKRSSASSSRTVVSRESNISQYSNAPPSCEQSVEEEEICVSGKDSTLKKVASIEAEGFKENHSLAGNKAETSPNKSFGASLSSTRFYG